MSVDILAQRLESIVGNGLAKQMRERRDAALLRALEARKTKVLQHKGELLYSEPLEDHPTQLAAARLTYEIDGAMPNRMEIGVDGQMRITSDAELLAILASLGPEVLMIAPAERALTTGEAS